MTRQDALIAFTNLGDLAVLLPVAAVILLWLMHGRARRDALWWAVAVGICIGGTALLKIAFFVCPPADTLHSPSGHTSLSALAYGGLALFAAAKTQGWRRAVILAVAVAVVGTIAVSRVLLSSHTWIETALGLSIGLGALALLAWRYLANPRLDLRVQTLVLVVALTIVVFHGRQLHAEGLLRAIGIELRSGGIACG